MVKATLAEKVASAHRLSMADAQRMVDAVFAAIAGALEKGERVEIRGFASFRVKQYPGYRGRNPRTGTEIEVRRKQGVVFKPGLELKRRIDVSAGRTNLFSGDGRGAERNAQRA